jgi:hypothetical protein
MAICRPVHSNLQALGFEPQPPPFFPTKKSQKLAKNKKKEGRGFEPKTSHSQTMEKNPLLSKKKKKKILKFLVVDHPSTTRAPPPQLHWDF